MIDYPQAHHTLEFEPDPERFIADLQKWLEHHLRDQNRRRSEYV